jgi:hypothetical protein
MARYPGAIRAGHISKVSEYASRWFRGRRFTGSILDCWMEKQSHGPKLTSVKWHAPSSYATARAEAQAPKPVSEQKGRTVVPAWTSR